LFIVIGLESDPDVTAIYSMCGYVDTLKLIVCIDTVPVFNMIDDTSICENTPLELFPDFQVELCIKPSYKWSTGDTSNNIYVTTTGMYSLTVTNSCDTWSDSIEIITIFPAPELNLGNDTSICNGDSITLDAGNNHVLCVWNTGDSADIITVDSAAHYWAKVTNEYGCVTTDFMDLFIDHPPEIKLGNDTLLCSGTELVLDVSNILGSVFWNDGTADPVFWVKETGDYWVLASNKCGEDADSIHVEIVPCHTKIYAPNSFTPNGDGLNDKFCLKGQYVKDFNMHIYNRWGELLYSTHNMNEGWNGTFQNKKCKNEVYNWIVHYADFFHEYHILSGQVILVR